MMGTLLEDDRENAQSERAVSSLVERNGLSLDEARSLFADELVRLKRHAKVGHYLHVLAMAGVRTRLRQRRVAQAQLVPTA